ncbi:MAG: GTPase Era, partial [Armatimonadota bacterium]
MSDYRAGAVAVVGRPNVGKSTLVNLVVGHKVSIVSDKPNTTRRRVNGIATTPLWQIVFVDTPGLHRAHDKLSQTLNESARGAMVDVEAVMVMVDGSKSPSAEDQQVASLLKDSGWIVDGLAKEQVVLCLNKMDATAARHVQENYEAYTKLFG